MQLHSRKLKPLTYLYAFSQVYGFRHFNVRPSKETSHKHLFARCTSYGCPPLQQCVSFPTWASQRCNEHFLWSQGIWPVSYISGHGYSSGPCWWTPCGFFLVCGDKCLVASTVHLNTSLQKWHWAHASSNSSGLRLYASKTFISCSTSSYMSVHVTLRTAFCPILNKLTHGLWSRRTANFCHAVYILYFFFLQNIIPGLFHTLHERQKIKYI